MIRRKHARLLPRIRSRASCGARGEKYQRATRMTRDGGGGVHRSRLSHELDFCQVAGEGGSKQAWRRPAFVKEKDSLLLVLHSLCFYSFLVLFLFAFIILMLFRFVLLQSFVLSNRCKDIFFELGKRLRQEFVKRVVCGSLAVYGSFPELLYGEWEIIRFGLIRFRFIRLRFCY